MSSTLDFSSRLKEARLKKGLSQNAVAEKLNISRQAVSRWETGKGMPDINTLPVLGELYGVSVAELLGSEPSASRSKPQNPTGRSGHSTEKVPDRSITKEEADTDSASSHPFHMFNWEYLFLMLLLILSSFITFVGLILSIYILVWTWKNRRRYRLILILSVVGVLIGLHHLETFIITSFPFFTTYTIEKVA